MSTPQTVDPRILRTRRTVLTAALEIVSELGFAGATIDAIAQRCGVARSTVYRHWPERTDLLLEAVGDRLAVVDDLALTDIRSDGVAVALFLARSLSSEPVGSVVAALLLESRRDPALVDLHRRFVERRRESVRRVVTAAVARGEVPSGTDVDAAMDDLAAPIFFRALMLHEPLDETWIDRHVDSWIHRLRTSPP
jgi:AcrR family transcriptional regulator